MNNINLLYTLLSFVSAMAAGASLYGMFFTLDRKSFPAWKDVCLLLLVWGITALMLSFYLADFAVR